VMKHLNPVKDIAWHTKCVIRIMYDE